MNLKQIPLVELTEEALMILQREFGTANTIRFIRQFSTGFGDYTAERSIQPEETLDELLDVIKARRPSIDAAKEANDSAEPSSKERMRKIRQQYPRAYEKWTEDEDAQLRKKYDAGVKVNELANLLHRQPGAIESRLRKLGLTD